MELKDDQKMEIDLIRRVGEGDTASLGKLYDRFAALLFSIAFKVLGNREAAEDVLQDVFVTIWQKAAAYDATRGQPLGWAAAIARNLSIDRLRSLQRRYRLEGELEHEAEIAGQPEEVVHHASLQERGGIVRAAVAQLTLDQRQAVELAFFGGLSQREIAAELGQPLGTIKARIRRGMLKLKELLSAKL